MTKFDYRQDITLLRVTIDGMLKALRNEQLQVFMRAPKSGQRLTRDEFGEGDQSLRPFIPVHFSEEKLGAVEFTATGMRLSAYVFCFTRNIPETLKSLRETMKAEIGDRKTQVENLENLFAKWD